MARDFKGDDKDRDDLFAETPPLEAKRVLLSRAATRLPSGRHRSLMFIDAKKAHLNPKCDDDVYVELPAEYGVLEGMCAKLKHWLYGMRPAAAAWERLYSDVLESKGFERGVSCGVVFYHKGMDVACAVHGDDFTFCGLREDLLVVQGWLREAFEIEVRGMLGESDVEDKEAAILG